MTDMSHLFSSFGGEFPLACELLHVLTLNHWRRIQVK